MKKAYADQGAAALRGQMADERYLYIFSQSMLKQIDVCPERGRRTLLDLMPRYNTDSTAIGHAVHEAIQLCVDDVIAGEPAWRLDDMYGVACKVFDEEMAEPSARWQKYSPQQAESSLWYCLNCWCLEVLPTLSPQSVELKLGPYTIYEDNKTVIQLQGQADYVDSVTGLADWKTSSRPWIPWEHKRWDIQPTVYSWLWDMERFGMHQGYEVPWTWHVLQTNGNYQKIETTRGPEDWAWLRDRLITTVQMLQANLPAWHKNDSSALCSPRWCGAYESCKGQHVTGIK